MNRPETVTDDLWVAGTAAGCAIALTIVLEVVLGYQVSLLLRLLPLVVYVQYLLSRRMNVGSLGSVRGWVVLTIAVTIATFAYVVL